MKKLFTMMMLAVLGFCLTACSNKDDDEVKLGTLTITVSGAADLADFEVVLTNATTTSSYTQKTDANGKASFQVTPGVYNAAVTATRYQDGYRYIFNGLTSNITLTADQTATATIELKEAKTSQVIIKELYVGGCPKEPSGYFANDKCFILYNNSAQEASLSNLCVAFTTPYNGHASNKNYGDDGKLTYEADGFTPAFGGMWWFQGALTIAPYSQIVVNVSGAIDNTQTYAQSINYAKSDYYCMYDPESGFSISSWYPTPAAEIPTTHYLKAKRLGTATSWPLSNSSPAFFIFQTKNATPATFADNADNLWYDGGVVKDINACLKVPNEWIVDAIEVYQTAKISDSKKRFTSDIDAGYVGLTNQQGHVLYRNVDKEATEALAENAGKLVFNYALGVDTTDPSGIDAEASIKNGAHIIFKDTNNSTNDFHERQKCSLRD